MKRPSRIRLAILVVPAVAHAASALAMSPAGASIAIPQRSDTAVVNIGAPRNAGVASLVREISIGQTDGAVEYLFSSLGGVAIGNDGRIYVLDRGSGTNSANRTGAVVRVYDQNGKFLRNIGRQGDGPGEYRTPLGIDRLPDGRVLVLDPGTNRINVYSAEGEPLAQWQTHDRARDFTPNRLMTDTAGFTYLRLSIFAGGGGATTTVWQRFDRDGRVMDSIASPPRPEVPRSMLTAGTQQRAVPFQPAFTSAFTRLGFFVTARTDRYAIDLLKPVSGGSRTVHWTPGARVTSLRRPVDGVAFAPGEREAWVTTIERVMRRLQPSWSWNGPAIPRSKPPVLGITSGQDGRLWVKLAAPGVSAPPENPGDSLDVDDNIPFRVPDIYDILEPDGRYIGQVRFVDRTLPMAMRGDLVWVGTVDADGVQRVIRYRITWAR